MTDSDASDSGRFVDPRPEYWKEYSNLQKMKHDLIHHYCNGWFPKLGYWAGKIVYLDTHAGRGVYASGRLGSPLVALDTLLKHRHRDTILARSKAAFIFIERDQENTAALRSELAHRDPLPQGVTCQAVTAECFSALRELITYFREPGRQFAPAFIFVDPYGFKVPGATLRELMEFQRVELFVNVIWRELDMATRQPERLGETLDLIFDGPRWRDCIAAPDHAARAHETVNLLKDVTQARWATYIRMLGPNDVTRYLLVHLTNHDAGRDLMKDCMWKACPDGGFYARKTDDPAQEYLIKPQPDLGPLRAWVLQRLPRHWKALHEDLRATVWRVPHLNKVVRELRKKGVVNGRGFSGKFLPSSNPELFVCQSTEA